MPAPITRYDAQLSERFGSIDAFRARHDSSDATAVFVYTRLAETEKELVRLRSQVHSLTSPGNYPDTGQVARVDLVLDAINHMIELRDDEADALETLLGLAAPATEHGPMFDPHWHLTPAPGTTPTTGKPLPPTDDDTDAVTAPFSRTGLTAFDARIEELAGDLDQLRALAGQPQADPALRELGERHIALTDAETVCLFYRVRVNTLTDGRWYVDRPLVDTIDEALTKLEEAIGNRSERARALEQLLARMGAETARASGSAVGTISTSPPEPAPAAPGDRTTAARAISPTAPRSAPPGDTPAVKPAPPNVAPPPVRHH
jgi:hypothetical protein